MVVVVDLVRVSVVGSGNCCSWLLVEDVVVVVVDYFPSYSNV